MSTLNEQRRDDIQTTRTRQLEYPSEFLKFYFSVYPNTWIDRTSLGLAVFGQAIPNFFFALLLILPEMLEAAASLPPGANPEVEGARIAQEAAASRLLEAFLLTTVTLVIGAYYQVLPGLRPRP